MITAFQKISKKNMSNIYYLQARMKKKKAKILYKNELKMSNSYMKLRSSTSSKEPDLNSSKACIESESLNHQKMNINVQNN